MENQYILLYIYIILEFYKSSFIVCWNIFQVSRSSYSPGIKIPVIKTLFDISEIQPYSINRNFIIYIQQRAPKENSNGSGINQSQRPLSNHKQRNYCETNHMRKRRCETCQWELTTLEDSSHNYKFCSMECKAVSSNELCF